MTFEDAVLHECMRIESGWVPDDPEKTLNNIITWHTELATENLVSVWELVKIRDKINDILQGKS